MNTLKKMRNGNSKGFSMIEILVVLAVIGLLTSVALAAMRTARNKGSDATVMKELNGIRTQAQIYFDLNRTYGNSGTSCSNSGSMFEDTTIVRQMLHAVNTSGQVGVCANDANSWVISVPLPGGGSWCVDSKNNGKNAVADTVAISCP